VALMVWPALSSSQAIKGLDHPESVEGSIPSNTKILCLGGEVGESQRSVKPFLKGELVRIQLQAPN
jgi:hypothetical protein